MKMTVTTTKANEITEVIDFDADFAIQLLTKFFCEKNGWLGKDVEVELDDDGYGSGRVIHRQKQVESETKEIDA